jgi:ABC-type amino acid transport system permease subunit
MLTRWPEFFVPFIDSPLYLSLVLTTIPFVIGFIVAVPMGLLRAYRSSLNRKEGGEVLSLARARELFGTPRAVISVLGRRLGRAILLPLYGVVTGYVEGIRGTPFFVQMWLVYFVIINNLPRQTRLFELVGIVALALNTIGYQAEVFRAGFQSVGQGQIEAAKAVGMHGRTIFLHITLPQSLRLVTLPLGNEWIGLLKASAIVSIIGVNELQHFANDIASGHPIEAFVMVSVMYLAVIVPLSRLITYLERVRRIPGLGMPMPTTAQRLFGVRRRPRAPRGVDRDHGQVRLAWKERDRLGGHV